MQMRLPTDLPPSMRGALITCDYFVKVKMKIGSFVKDIKLKVGGQGGALCSAGQGQRASGSEGQRLKGAEGSAVAAL